MTDKPVVLKFPIELEEHREKPQGLEPTTLTQPTYDAGAGNQIHATLVGNECSHHCTITATM